MTGAPGGSEVIMKLLLVRAAAVAAALVWTAAASASSPMGVFARVDKVEYEPSKQTATKVVIHGVFALQAGSGMFDYSGPYAGYMYFACPSGSEADCREQWSEIEANVGKSLCVGWGQELVAPGTVRSAGAPLASPDTYDLGMGVAYASYANGWCPKLLAYGTDKPPTDGGGVIIPVTDAGGSNSGSGKPPSGSPTSPSPSSSSAAKDSSAETATAGCAAAGTGGPELGLAGLAIAAFVASLRRRTKGAR
jgi:MYXO-CTERM domain-containing protein